MFEDKPTLYVFSNKRACNAFCAQQADGFLPVVWSVQEFYTQMSFVGGLQKIPESVRQVLLVEAIREVAQEQSTKEPGLEHLVVFEKSFLGYLDGSVFVARFFNELAKFDLDIKQISTQDIYGDYAHHLEVLECVYKRYRSRLEDLGFYDPILRIKPTLLPCVLERFARIEFYMEGFLSAHEKDMLFGVNEIVPVILHTTCDRYNKAFLHFLGLDLLEDHSYSINLQALSQGKNAILSDSYTPFDQDKIRIYGFNERMDQIGLALARVQEWLGEGLEPSTLAIITPSPDISAPLKLLDTKHNLNFARGQDARFVYKAYLRALNRFKTTPVASKHPLDALKEQCGALLKATYPTPPPLLEQFHQEFFDTHTKIKSALKNYDLLDLLELYVRALESLRIDDVGGGKIKVLDVLESRGLHFDRVVLLDCNDHLVPSIQDDDLFLNTNTRTQLKIPTLKDKQDLQKHYYYQLLKNANQVDIAYSHANNATHSKMLLELNLTKRILSIDSAPYFRLFPKAHKFIYKEEACLGTIPVGFEFSASKIHDFLACKRRFYLKYLKKYTPLLQEGFDLSSFLHDLLYDHYSAHPQTPISKQSLQGYAHQSEKFKDLSPLERLDVAIIVDKMEAFFMHEKTHLQHARVWACEKNFSIQREGFVIKGRIDRVDAYQDGSYAVIDYKLKSNLGVDQLEDLEKSQDYQLAIYKLAAQSFLPPDARIRAYLCDLKGAKNLTDLEEKEEVFQEKQRRLDHLLQSFKSAIDFKKNPSRQTCQYCPYVDMCGV